MDAVDKSDSHNTGEPEHAPKPRRLRRWVWALALSTALCAIWLAVTWKACLVYFYGPRAHFPTLLYLWLWLIMMFGLRLKGRLFLLGATALFLMFFPPPERNPAAAAQAYAVGHLRHLFESVRQAKELNGKFPESLPDVSSGPRWIQFYSYRYIPQRSTDGTIKSYYIEAVPNRRECGCSRSFLIADDGVLHYTMESRPAKVSDQVLE